MKLTVLCIITIVLEQGNLTAYGYSRETESKFQFVNAATCKIPNTHHLPAIMNMPKNGIIAGALLIALALLGYFGGGMVSWTALIPAIAGVPILLGSLIARNPDKLKTGMHIAAVFGLLGFIAPLGRIIPTAIKGKFEFNLATSAMIGMCLICGVFTFLCIKSFKEARRAKESS